MFCHLLSVIALFSVAFAADPASTWLLQAYRNSDHAGHVNPIANLEVHCVQLDAPNGNPVYVKGTYGQRGYFEGPVSNMHASVNYWDVSLHDGELATEAGTAWWEYDANRNVVLMGGMYMESGQETVVNPMSVMSWGFHSECANVWDCLGSDYSGMTPAEIAQQFCFWDVRNDNGYDSFGNVRPYPWWIFGADNPNSFYMSNLGFNSDLGGTVLGAYRYTYTDEDCQSMNCGKFGSVEWGVYKPDMLLGLANTSAILAGTWHATTGPFQYMEGTIVYSIQAAKGGKKQTMFGFFCNTKFVDHNDRSKGKMFIGCSIDNNDIVPRNQENKNLAISLFKTYKHKMFDDWWSSWNTWVNAVFGAPGIP